MQVQRTVSRYMGYQPNNKEVTKLNVANGERIQRIIL